MEETKKYFGNVYFLYHHNRDIECKFLFLLIVTQICFSSEKSL